MVFKCDIIDTSLKKRLSAKILHHFVTRKRQVSLAYFSKVYIIDVAEKSIWPQELHYQSRLRFMTGRLG